MFPGASHLQFSHLNRGKKLHAFFEQITSHEYKDLNHVSWWIVCIFHQDMLIWKNFSTYFILVRNNIYVSRKDYSFIIETNQKDLG